MSLEKEIENILFKELYEEYSDDILKYSLSVLKNYEQ